VAGPGLAGRVGSGWFSVVVVTQYRLDSVALAVGVLCVTCPTTVVNRPGHPAHHVGLIRSLSHIRWCVVTPHSDAA
jgi:hypothetical protein